MVKKVKGEKAATRSFCFAGENKKILEAVEKMAEEDRRDYSFTLCELLKKVPEVQARLEA